MILRDSQWLPYCATDDVSVARVLALWIPGKTDHVILLRSDLDPLAVTADERAEVMKRIDQARAS